jgi:hypothetical protein
MFFYIHVVAPLKYSPGKNNFVFLKKQVQDAGLQVKILPFLQVLTETLQGPYRDLIGTL